MTTGPLWLATMLLVMQQAAGQAPPDMKPAIDLILKRAQERLATLEKK